MQYQSAPGLGSQDACLTSCVVDMASAQTPEVDVGQVQPLHAYFWSEVVEALPPAEVVWEPPRRMLPVA